MINMIDKKRLITGAKKFGGRVAYAGGKYGLKAVLKVPELACIGGSKMVDSLSQSEQAQVIATTAGIITASVVCPPVALGVAGVIGAKYLADKILDKPKVGIIKSTKETLMLGNNITKLACNKVISPAAKFVENKSKNLGSKVQGKVDDLFTR